MRRRAYEAIAAKPGLSVRALARKLDTTWPNAKYHVLRLERAGLVASRIVGRRRICYVADEHSDEVIEARGILAEPTAQALAAYIAANPGRSLAEIVTQTRVSQRVAYHHLKRFIERGLVAHSDEARYRGLVPTAVLYNALA